MTMRQHRRGRESRLGKLWVEYCLNCAAYRPLTKMSYPKGPWRMPDGTPAPWCQMVTERQP